MIFFLLPKAAVVFRRRAFLLWCCLLFIINISSLYPVETDPSVLTVSKRWTDVENNFIYYLKGTITQEPLLFSIDAFSCSLEEFFQSYHFKGALVTFYSPVKNTRQMQELCAALFENIQNRENDAAIILVEQIRTELSELQKVDAHLTDFIIMRYFYQFIVFTIVIAIMTLVSWRLYNALLRSRIKAQQASSFSRDIVFAQESERARISRELHDTVAQDLRYLMMAAGKIRSNSENPRLWEICDEITTGQGNIISRIRDICNGLIPPDFAGLGLENALCRLCSDFEQKTGIRCPISIPENLDMGNLCSEMQLQCYRLVQESLTNIEKHAAAAEASVLVRNAVSVRQPHRKSLLICVSDDGKGFFPADKNKQKTSLGIRGMYERAAILKGVLSFVSSPNEGTMVRIEIPL